MSFMWRIRENLFLSLRKKVEKKPILLKVLDIAVHSWRKESKVRRCKGRRNSVMSPRLTVTALGRSCCGVKHPW